jgi:hypothetical protein
MSRAMSTFWFQHFTHPSNICYKYSNHSIRSRDLQASSRLSDVEHSAGWLATIICNSLCLKLDLEVWWSRSTVTRKWYGHSLEFSWKMSNFFFDRHAFYMDNHEGPETRRQLPTPGLSHYYISYLTPSQDSQCYRAPPPDYWESELVDEHHRNRRKNIWNCIIL